MYTETVKNVMYSIFLPHECVIPLSTLVFTTEFISDIIFYDWDKSHQENK